MWSFFSFMKVKKRGVGTFFSCVKKTCRWEKFLKKNRVVLHAYQRAESKSMINFIYRVLNIDPHLLTEINRLTIELTLGSEEVQMLVQKRNAIANLSSPNNNNQQQLENGAVRPNVSQYSICILHTKYFCCGISCNFSLTLFQYIFSLLKLIFSEKATKLRRNLQKYF